MVREIDADRCLDIDKGGINEDIFARNRPDEKGKEKGKTAYHARAFHAQGNSSPMNEAGKNQRMRFHLINNILLLWTKLPAVIL